MSAARLAPLTLLAALAVAAALFAIYVYPAYAQESSAPDKPIGLTGTATHDAITLTWDDPGDDSITGYMVLRRVRVNDQGGDFSELVADTGTAALTYTDVTVAAETRYTYRIKAINEHGASERSRWYYIATPAAPERRSEYVDAHNAGVHDLAELTDGADPLNPDAGDTEEEDDKRKAGKQGKSVGTQQGRSNHTVNICNRTPEIEAGLLALIADSDPSVTCSTVTAAQLASVDYLHIRDGYSSQEIVPSDFVGLTGLIELSISGSRQLTTVPANAFSELSGLTKFQNLGLSRSRIKTVHRDAFDGLNFSRQGSISLGLNHIETLEPGTFDGVTGLEQLRLENNHIKAFEDGFFENLTDLEQLDISGNRLRAIDQDTLRGLSSLRILTITSNPLSTLHPDAFDHLSALERLTLQANAIAELPADIFADVPDSLWEIRLSVNNISSLDPGTFAGLTGLRTLNLDNNDLSELPEDVFDGLSALEKLDLASNSLTELPEDIFDPLDDSLIELILNGNNFGTLPADVFDGLDGLQILWLHQAGLTNLPEDIFEPLDDSLWWLTLHGNEFTSLDEDLFDGLTGLQRLYLYDNGLTTLPSGIFEDPGSSLLWLILNDNNFGSLDEDLFDGLTGLQLLYLHRAGLMTLDEDLFNPLDDSLQRLYLFGNDFTSLDEDLFDGLTGLQRLYLQGNGLTSLHEDVFDGLSSLQFLYLDGNELTSLPADIFDDLAVLEDLNLDENLLSALTVGVFNGLGNSLTDLYLRDNSLTALPSGVFAGLTGLERLDLSCNALTTLNLEVFDPFAGTLKYLDLGANSFTTPPTEAAVNAKLTVIEALYLTGTRPCLPAFDTGLGALSLSTGMLSPAFVAPGTSRYRADVSSEATELTITVGPRDPHASIEPGPRGSAITYDDDLSMPGLQVHLDNRDNVRWQVRAENGAATQVYNVSVYREHPLGSVTRLRSLELSGLTLTPKFGSTTYEYKAKGPATATETSVIAIPLDPDAEVAIMVNGAPAEAGATVDISPDASTAVTVEVTAEDGTPQTYQVTVTLRAVDAPGEEGEFRLTPDMQEDYEDPDNSRYAGKQSRLEVFHSGRWGTVCSDRFKGSDITTHPSHGNLAPKLSCQAMGYDDGEYASGYGTSEPHQSEADQDNYLRPGGTYPASGPLPIWLDDVMCWTRDDWPFGDDPTPDYGRLMYLENPEDPEDQTMTPYLCAYAGWGLHNGTHQEDAGVRCWYDSEQSAQDSERALRGHFLLSPEQHDGSNRVTVKVGFSEPIDETPEGLRNHGVRVEGGEVTAVHREGGQPGAGTRSAGGPASGQVVWVIEIQPTSAEDLTLSLDGGRPCHEAGAICTADGRTLSKGISTTVKGPSSLTASFQDMPDTHDGETPFTFRVAFSEDIAIGLPALREDAFTVTGGAVTDGQRVDDQHDLFEVTVEPNSGGDVTITLPAGRDCSVSGAICTTGKNQRLLSNSPTAKVAGPANAPATGAPTISGTAQVGETLAAGITGIADADGLSGESFTYQWVSGDGTTDTDIEKATGSTYKLVAADQGKAIRVRVTFTDGGGNEETLTSAPTGPVWGDGRPGAPRNLAATPGNKEVTLSWDPPADNGNAPATGYRIEWRVDGKDYDKNIWGTARSTSYTTNDQANLANGVKYFFRVRAGNGSGNSQGPYGPASGEVSATPTSGSTVDLGTPVLSDTETLHHGMARLDWKDVEDAGWYVVQYYHVEDGEWVDLPAEGVDVAFHGSSAVASNLHGLSWLRVRAASCDGTSEWSQIEQWFGTNASDWEGVPVPDVEEGDEIEPCPVVLGTPVLSDTENLHHGMVELDWKDIEDAGWYVVQYYHLDGGSGEWVDLPAEGVEIRFHGSSAVVSNLHGLSWLRVRAMSCAGESEWSQIEQLFGTNASDWEGVPVPEVAEGDEIEPCSEDADTSDNSPATGAPTINGTAQVGETLTANTSGIADADGLSSVQYEYQWLAEDSDISGATNATYTLVAGDEGKAITVRVSFTDDAGNNETLISAATASVAAEPASNSPATGTPTISGTAQVGETLTADTSGVADADGLTNVSYSYQWLADDAAIAGATGFTYTLAAADEGKAIRVEVSFTDDAGNDESLTSAATGAVDARPNSPATGAPAITGTAQVGETLTADASGIADADGLANATFGYQWLAGDTDIAGASGLTYTLTDSEESKAITVQVGFTDDADNEETLTSAATAAVAAKPNSPATGAPTIDGTVQVGEPLTANTSGVADADGLSSVQYEYQWLADDAEIAGATGLIYTVAAADEGKAITVQVSFTDDAGNGETLTSAATDAVAAAPTPNSPATGVPSVSGTAQVGETLTAHTSGIADADGLDDVSFTYQWLADDADISGATNATYTLAAADEGKAVKVEVSFTDDAGNDESLTSAATEAVAAAEPSEPPAKPRNLSATASHDSVTLTWDDPQDDSITGYVVLRRIPGVDPDGQFSELVADTGSAATTYTDDTVAASTTYTYRIKAINGAGTSERSRWFHIDIPAAPVPDKPTGLSATATHDQVVLTWDDPSDSSITGYVILRRNRDTDAEGHFNELVSDTSSAATTYTDNTVEAETRYTYRIKAINQYGASDRSRWYHIDTPAAP